MGPTLIEVLFVLAQRVEAYVWFEDPAGRFGTVASQRRQPPTTSTRPAPSQNNNIAVNVVGILVTSVLGHPLLGQSPTIT